MNLVSGSTNLVSGSTNFVSSSTNLVSSSTNFVGSSTNLVSSSTNLVSSSTNPREQFHEPREQFHELRGQFNELRGQFNEPREQFNELRRERWECDLTSLLRCVPLLLVPKLPFGFALVPATPSRLKSNSRPAAPPLKPVINRKSGPVIRSFRFAIGLLPIKPTGFHSHSFIQPWP